jgi:hypothetical protein
MNAIVEENKVKFSVKVAYNGVPREIEVKTEERIEHVLKAAIAAFGNPPNPHTLALFTTDGRELADAQTVEEAGLKPGQELILRTSTVKGGQ